MRQYSTDLPALMADGSSGRRTCIDRARKPVAIVVQKQGKRIVGRDFRKRQGFIAGQRADITALVQHDTVPCGDRNRNLIVPSEIAIQTDRLQIIIDNCEQPWVVHLKLSSSRSSRRSASTSSSRSSTPPPNRPQWPGYQIFGTSSRNCIM